MKIVTKKEFLAGKERFIEEMKAGKIFVYPTDTIYGIGCSALNSESVVEIREIKKRDAKPFSVIAPSKEWIRQNCEIDKLVEKWLAKLPGPFTLILDFKEKGCVVSEVIAGAKGLGVRIPDHWFSEIVSESGVPFVTTSMNVSGEPNVRDVKEISSEMAENIDYAIDDGVLGSGASRVVSLVGGVEKFYGEITPKLTKI